MVKGIGVKFKNYSETLPKMLNLINFNSEIKKHSCIVLKVDLNGGIKEGSSKIEFVEEILKFIVENRNPGTEIFIAEGCDGANTDDVFDKFGYKNLSEKYGVGLVDLNKTELEDVENNEFLRFEKIEYPKLLKESFVISLPFLREDEEFELAGSLSNMLGAFPANRYSGFFSSMKNKIRKWPIKYAIHDILKCKMPDFVIIDASDRRMILAGQAIEMDKQAAKLLELDWKEIGYMRLVDEGFSKRDKTKNKEDLGIL